MAEAAAQDANVSGQRAYKDVIAKTVDNLLPPSLVDTASESGEA